MTVDRRSTLQGTADWTAFANVEDIPDWISKAYTATYRGPHADEREAEAPSAGRQVDQPDVTDLVVPALLSAHYQLARHRAAGESRVAVYPADDPAGFGPALQVVTDYGTMLMDSVTVLLHRLGVAYVAIMNPVFEVHRNADGDLLSVEPNADNGSQDGLEETWTHVQLSPSVNGDALTAAERLLPSVLADVRRVADDSAAMIATLNQLVTDLKTDREGHYRSPDREDVAALLCWLADGNFMLLGYQRCPVEDGIASVDESSSLGVLRGRTEARRELTDDGKLLVLVQATVPSYMRYGAYPYIVVVRENDETSVVEHRFIGLFTVAAMNADVLEIPMISRRVREALEMADRDPSHPGQLLLDVIQTVPRSELFALSAQRLLAMAEAVVDLGSRRRTLLFLRADPLEHFVSCLVYLPRDRYTTAVR
ncbi:MAG: NAD-glutamate dehydrogenase, partial [Mycobacterium sp.]|nr:NAD-glutamate dehydrogenase [Mycobacterium sp.]